MSSNEATAILALSGIVTFGPPFLFAYGLGKVNDFKGDIQGFNIGGLLLLIVLILAYWSAIGFSAWKLVGK